MKSQVLVVSLATVSVALLTTVAMVVQGAGGQVEIDEGAYSQFVCATDGLVPSVQSPPGRRDRPDAATCGASSENSLILAAASDVCSAPTLLAPLDGATLETLSPLFEWDCGNNPEATGFSVQLSEDQAFVSGLLTWGRGHPQGIGRGRFWRNLLPDKVYYWRAYLQCGQTRSPYTPVWSLRTGSQGAILESPSLLAPADGATLASWPVTLQWLPVTGAIEYLVQWEGGETPGFEWVTETHLALSARWIQPHTLYRWWVSALNDYAIGDESARWRFTTADQPTRTPTSTETRIQTAIPTNTPICTPTCTPTATPTVTPTATRRLIWTYLPVMTRGHRY